MDKKECILKAYQEKYAIPAFNFDSLEMAKYILEECNQLNTPVFIAASESAIKYMGGYNVVSSLIKSLIDLNIQTPVILHLDHGKTYESCQKAIESGFDSVMLDLSQEDINYNIQNIQNLVNNYPNTIVECEVGSIGKNGNESIIYADINEIIRIKEEANPFLIAPAIGTVHGLYKGTPNINIELLKQINQQIKSPLVLHGGSDTPDDIIKECIKNGITKININTELKLALHNAEQEFIKQNPAEIDYRKKYKYAEQFIKQLIKQKVELFRN